MSYPEPLEFDQLSTYSVHDRFSKVTVEHFTKPLNPGCSLADFIASLPQQFMGVDFPELITRLAASHTHQHPIYIGMGAHVIKVGMNPILIDLMQQGLIQGIALNGAGIIHDSEIAMVGRTSEDVGAVLGDGAFGAAKETGEVVNTAIVKGAQQGLGLGQAMGKYLVEQNFPYNDSSLLAMAYKFEVPVTVHVAVGTDIVHIHPSADGAAIGATSHQDFKLFCRLMSKLENGAYLNLGSAVILPEVFLKALTVVRNLGYTVENFTTANFDFIRHYRTMTNVVNRPTATGGKGFNFIGHHELMIPLLAIALKEEISRQSN
jgi:deoxyhypusine synthase